MFKFFTFILKVLVTGSSGYVASHLAPLMQQKATVYGVDQSFSMYTDIQSKIESVEFKNHLKRFNGKELTIVNLAAARFDFGATAKDYYRLNVECHDKFLESLINHLATLISEIVGYSGQIKFDSSKPDGAPRKLMDGSRLSAMGWSSKIRLRDGLIESYNWFVDNNDSVRR
jgi:nucleoside-diphosphate-sugar epimerase